MTYPPAQSFVALSFENSMETQQITMLLEALRIKDFEKV